MSKVLSQCLFLLAFSVALGVASYAVRPGLLPWNPSQHELMLGEAMALEDALWVDAREESNYEEAHFEGAVLVNEESWEMGFANFLERWEPGMPIVVYCSSQSCPRSHHVAERLRVELGIEEAYVLRGGWEALLKAGIVDGGSR